MPPRLICFSKLHGKDSATAQPLGRAGWGGLDCELGTAPRTQTAVDPVPNLYVSGGLKDDACKIFLFLQLEETLEILYFTHSDGKIQVQKGT